MQGTPNKDGYKIGQAVNLSKMDWDQLQRYKIWVDQNFHSIPGAKTLWGQIRREERAHLGTRRGSVSSRGKENWAYLQRRQREDAAKRPDRRHQVWGPNPTYGEWRAGG